MPRCKKCNARLTRLDKDICPFCGVLKPLDGQDDSTEDFTKAFDPIKMEDKVVKQKSKKTAAILMVTLGVFGIHAFYLKKWKLGLIILASSLALIAGVGCLLYFLALHNAFAFLIPYFALEIVMIIGGIIMFNRNDNTDANGEFLR